MLRPPGLLAAVVTRGTRVTWRLGLGAPAFAIQPGGTYLAIPDFDGRLGVGVCSRRTGELRRVAGSVTLSQLSDLRWAVMPPRTPLHGVHKSVFQGTIRANGTGEAFRAWQTLFLALQIGAVGVLAGRARMFFRPHRLGRAVVTLLAAHNFTVAHSMVRTRPPGQAFLAASGVVVTHFITVHPGIVGTRLALFRCRASPWAVSSLGARLTV